MMTIFQNLCNRLWVGGSQLPLNGPETGQCSLPCVEKWMPSTADGIDGHSAGMFAG